MDVSLFFFSTLKINVDFCNNGHKCSGVPCPELVLKSKCLTYIFVGLHVCLRVLL